MLDKKQALSILKATLPEVSVKACAPFQEFYLFRVEYPSVLEKDWDPFFSVDIATGEVRDFSVVDDLTVEEFNALEWEEV